MEKIKQKSRNVVRDPEFTSGENTLTDITKEELMERIKELEKEKNFFSDIIELNPYSIMISDKDGKILKVNQAFKNLFHTEPPPGYTIFNDPNIKRNKVEYLFEKLKKGEMINAPTVWFNAKKDINPSLPSIDIYLATTYFPLKDKKGNIFNYVTIHRDLTLQKKAEDVLKEKIKELEKTNKLMVGRELTMIELKEKIKQLEAGK